MSDAAQPPHDALRDLLIALQFAYANDGTEAGTTTAVILGQAAMDLAPLPLCDDPSNGEWRAALDAVPGPLNATLRAAAPLLPWYHAGLDDGKIGAETARHMLTAELIGPQGLIFNDTVRVGLFWQDAGVDYPVRTHAAEECYVMLAGSGWWSVDFAPHSPKLPGDVMFHPSFAAHASRTHKMPMLAAWRWSGDIGWESYSCVNGNLPLAQQA